MYKVYAIDFKYRDYDKEARKDMKNKRSVSTQKPIKAPFVWNFKRKINVYSIILFLIFTKKSIL